MTIALLLDSAGFGEWFLLLAVVLIVVGPEKLPSVARKFGGYYAKFRRAAESFKRQLLDLETEMNRTADAAGKGIDEAFTVDGDEASATPAAMDADPSVPPAARASEPPPSAPADPPPAEPVAAPVAEPQKEA